MNIVKELVAYVTISDDAYGDNAEIVPYFGWKGSTAAGAVLLNGLTVRKVGDQWNDAEENFGFTTSGSTNGVLAKYVWKNNEINDSPIAYQTTVEAKNSTTQGDFVLTAPAFDQSDGATNWTLSFWAKTVDGLAGNGTTLQFGSVSKPIKTNGNWQFFTETVTGKTLDDALLRFTVSRKSTLYLNGMSLVPGEVALANESGQNSAVLKNVTVDTGSKQFNTAIEYDTDEAFTSYSRVKHYIIDGEAYSYSYDTAGNIQKIQNPDGSWVSYEYDALDQLTAEHHSSCLPLSGEVSAPSGDDGGVVTYNTVSYEYDTRGNILSKVYSLNGETVDTITYTYGNTVWKDQLTSFDGVSIDYDEIGNPDNWINGETLSWQHGRQLASYSKNGNTISYTYNSDGIRTSKTEKVNDIETTTTYNVVDGVLRSLTQGNHTLRFFDNQILYNDTSYWFVTNAQNDVIGIIDQNGDYVVEYTYDSWGNITSQTDSELARLNPFRYRGYIYDDETGLYYVSSRYYDPEVGRFLNADNEALVTATPEVPHWDKNLYAYCDNNPIMRHDVSGRFWETILDVVSLGASIVEVCVNPVDPLAWAALVGDVVDVAVPFVGGIGEVTRAVSTTVKVVDKSEDVLDAAKTVYKTAEATSDIRKATGSYEIAYKSGYHYIGKGGFDRALDSAARNANQYGDEVTSIMWKSAPSGKDAFIDEYMMQKRYYDSFDSAEDILTYNKIWSPGRKYYATSRYTTRY